MLNKFNRVLKARLSHATTPQQFPRVRGGDEQPGSTRGCSECGGSAVPAASSTATRRYPRSLRSGIEAQKSLLRPLRRDPVVVPLTYTPGDTRGVGRMLVDWSSHCHRSTCWHSGLGAG